MREAHNASNFPTYTIPHCPRADRSSKPPIEFGVDFQIDQNIHRRAHRRLGTHSTPLVTKTV